jgi:flagellar biosynthesis/type III secretory pathway chaperone
VLRQLVTLPFSMARAAIDLPRTMQRSVKEANELMELSREQLEVMRRQADQALEQAERMNDLLARVVKLTEPLERAQRGGELVGETLKRAIFGAEEQAEVVTGQAEEIAAETRGGAAGEAEAPPDSQGAADEAER